jgi:SRSO17 transposase
MVEPDGGWRANLERWLEPFLVRLSHPARRAMCPLYIAGLIGPGERKSVQPMAHRLGLSSHDQLHHFISAGLWDAAPLAAELLTQADRLVGGPDAYLVIDDTALPKKGQHSVGVAPQYASALGKNANCQTLVSLTLAKGEVPVPVSLRLFLPESWTNDPQRMQRAGVPEPFQAPRTKPEIALCELDRIIAAGVRFGCVLADAGYGISAAFRQALSARGLVWAVGIPRIQKVFRADVEMIWPTATRGRPRQTAIPGTEAIAAEDMLTGAPWRAITWRRGTKGALKAEFVALRVRVADGPAVRINKRVNQHLPGEEVWLVGERRASGKRKYYLSNLPADVDLKRLAGTIKARWVCEQAHQQMKEELGLDHFEGRSWTGLHRHALMTLIAFAFLQHQRLAATKRGKKRQRTAAPAEPAGGAPGHCRPPHASAPAAGAMSSLPTMDHAAS